MKMRQLKKILSITLASAMLITSVPSGTFASESETLPTEQTSETGSGNEETGSGEQGSGSEETGSGEQGSGTEETGSGTEETGSGEQGSGTEETGSGEQGSGTEETGSGEQGSGTEETGSGEQGSGTEETGSETEETETGETGNETEETETGETGNETEETEGEETEKETEETESETEETISVEWSIQDGASFTYDGKNHAPTATINGVDVSYKIKKDDESYNGTEITEPGSYTLTVTSTDGKKLGDNERRFSIEKKEVSLKWGNLAVTYTGEEIPLPTATFKCAEDPNEMITVDDVSVAKEDKKPLVDGKIVNVGTYRLVAELTKEQAKYYKIKDDSANPVFTVNPMQITIKAKADRWKYYGAKDPEFYDYDVEIPEGTDTKITVEKVKTELANLGERILTREEGENVKWKEEGKVYDGYVYKLTRDKGDYGNFTVTYEKTYDAEGKENVFVIKQLPIKIAAVKEQDKYYREADKPYDYEIVDFEKTKEDTKTELSANDVKVELNKKFDSKILKREEGEDVKEGGYAYDLARAEDAYGNFTVTYEKTYDAEGKENVFVIKPLPIKVAAVKEQDKYYGEADKPYDYEIVDFEKTKEDTKTELSANDVKAELNKKFDSKILKREEGEDVKEGGYEYDLTQENGDYGNFKVTYVGDKDNVFVIEQYPIAIEWGETEFIYDGTIQRPSVSVTEGFSVQISYYKKNTEENTESEVGKTKNAGKYTAMATVLDSNGKPLDTKNYKITNNSCEFEIEKLPITISPKKDQWKYYGADEPELFTYTIENEENKLGETEIAEELKDQFGLQTKDQKVVLLRRVKEAIDKVDEAGQHDLELVFSKEEANNYYITYNLENVKFEIKQLPITIRATQGQWKYYGAVDPEYDYEVEIQEGTNTKINEEEVKKQLNEKFDSKILKRAPGENVVKKENGKYGGYAYDLARAEDAYGNFTVKYEPTYDEEGEDNVFVIKQLPITIRATGGQYKYYGGAEPEFYDYKIIIENNILEEERVISELVTYFELDNLRVVVNGQERIQLLQRVNGEDAGTYDLVPTFTEMDSCNYKIEYNGEFEIKPLPVTIRPEKDQSKIFGLEEPTPYKYEVEFDTKITNLTNEKVEEELEGVLTRVEGEKPQPYDYKLISEWEEMYSNFAPKIPEDAPEFKIEEVEITSITSIDGSSIDSRQSEFMVETNMTGKKRAGGIDTRFKIKVACPKETNGITFYSEEEEYITNSLSGIGFDDEEGEITIDINKVKYYKTGRNNEELQWDGYLPAKTEITISVVSDLNGKEIPVSKKTDSDTVTVTTVPVTLKWASNSYNSAATGYYVISNNGRVDSLTLENIENGEGELVELQYEKDGSGNGVTSYDYEELNPDLYFTPSANNAGSRHVMQSVTANIVDTLNLDCKSQELTFYVDDSAFEIPGSSIQFENRGQEIKIQLPEMGTVTGVTIPGGTVAVGKESGKVSQEFSFPVSWSGKDLISTGTSISVEYKDQAEHMGKGTAVVTRSTVSTPITFRIRPELNASGYLNGRSSTLIVSGTACSCEPIKVTAADMSQSTFATQKEVWSDSNGSWEVLFDMSGLPEEQEFSISAEYVDVNGPGHSITARFDAFCADPAVVSPIYEAMTHISGMVEPGTAVALVVNGQEQNYYEIQVDRFGHFSMDDVPMMFGKTDEDGDGELEMGDTFDIYVTDIAGNVAIRHYEIDEPGDPFEVSSAVNPLGKFIYSAEEKDSVAYVATPVSLEDFEEEKDSLELPLLMGMSYEAGTLTVQKSENGFTVSSEIQIDEAVDAEDYRVENEKLYVYTAEPSVEDLENRTGQEYPYGAEIPLGEGETVWIVADSDMTILADDIMDLKLFDYENSEEYVKYQEQ